MSIYIDIDKAKYIGIVEIQDDQGEFHIETIVETDKYLVYGGACNVGLLQHGHIEKDDCFSLDENLQALVEELELHHNGNETEHLVYNA